MRARFEDVPWPPDESFLVREYDLPQFSVPWHFHPELELTFIQQGQGDRSVGDHLGGFTAGDLVLLGPNLPHYWRSGGVQSPGERARAIVVHFRPDSFGQGFLDLPENKALKLLFRQAERGVHFHGPVAEHMVGSLSRLPALAGGNRLLGLLQILHGLAEAPSGQKSILASAPYTGGTDTRTADRMRRVYEHLYTHLEEPLSLPEIAQVAGMSEAAFSRYCKKATGRTLTRLINELRVSKACKLLIETEKSVSEVAFLSGFQSLSNFNRAFADCKNLSPSAYRTAFLR
ncbi:MAG: helix-turn-helix domain-containing protein [Verrucomicrobium sp.]|nr:AraC family transcriptional regulator [Verrucomicrobium sp.]